MRNVPVAEAMTSHVTAVPAELTVAEVAEKMGNDGERAVVIVDTNGQLDGIATLRDVEAALLDNNPGLSISHAATRPVVTVFPDESLSHAAHRLGARSWPAAGRRARTRASDCRHARESLLVAIKRGSETFIPRGDTRLKHVTRCRSSSATKPCRTCTNTSLAWRSVISRLMKRSPALLRQAQHERETARPEPVEGFHQSARLLVP